MNQNIHAMRQNFQFTILALCLFLMTGLGCKRNENKLPVAKAGDDRVITLPVNFVNLDGSSSSDPDGTIKSFIWEKKTGPGSFTIVTASAAKTEVKDLVAGVYEFELKVVDDDGGYSKDIVRVSVNANGQPNQAPVADAGADQVINVPAATVFLDGRKSFDPDSNILTYSWKQVGGPSLAVIMYPGLSQTQVNGLVGGSYNFELTVADTAGLTDKDTVHVIINRPPLSDAGTDQIIYLPANSVMLDGSNSFDPDNNITSYKWTKVFGPSSFSIANATSPQTLVTNLAEGEYWFYLQVKDAGNLAHTTYVVVRVDTTMPANLVTFNNLYWQNGCTLPVNNIFSFIQQGQPFKVYVRWVDSNGLVSNWQYARPLNLSSNYEMFNYEIVNGNLVVNGAGFDCAWDDPQMKYTIGIVML